MDVVAKAGSRATSKRIRKLTATMAWGAAALRNQAEVHDDTVWLADSTPVECTRYRKSVKRSDLVCWAEYGYCASYSCSFWGAAPAPGVRCARTAHGMGQGR